MELTLLIFLPLAAALAVLLVPSASRTAVRGMALAGALVCFAASIIVFFLHTSGQLEPVDFVWLKIIPSYFYLELNGIGAVLILLTGFLTLLAVVGSFSADRPREKLYFAMLLVLESALFGVFSARDFLVFYLFWEAVLIPMFFLIGIWGSENRLHAAFKFFIYTFLGSVLMLAGILIVAGYGGAGSFRFEDLFAAAAAVSPAMRQLAFWLVFVGLAVKLPVFPLHTWLPDAHVQAPTAASVMLAGVLLKMGGYGMLVLLYPMFPDLVVRYAMVLLVLAAVSIVYGALVAFAQTDIKKLVAYSSVAHMGFVTAGLASASSTGFSGAAYAMWAHGLITGMLFFLVGMAYERFHSRRMAEVNSLAARIPELGWAFVFAAMASLGLPGLAGFIGEFLTVAGVYQTFGRAAAAVAAGVFLNATYLLKLVRECVFTPGAAVKPDPEKINLYERLVIWPLVLVIFATGVYPEFLLKYIREAVSLIGG